MHHEGLLLIFQLIKVAELPAFVDFALLEAVSYQHCFLFDLLWPFDTVAQLQCTCLAFYVGLLLDKSLELLFSLA